MNWGRKKGIAHCFLGNYAKFAMRDASVGEFKGCITSCYTSTKNHIYESPSHLSLFLSRYWSSEVQATLGITSFGSIPTEKKI